MNWEDITILTLVSATSLASLILSVFTLEDHPNKEEYVVLNICGISALFIAMTLRGLIPENPFLHKSYFEWLGILSSGLSLAFISIAYGANIDHKTNVLLGVSLVSLASSALFGHFMKKQVIEEKEEDIDNIRWGLRLMKLLFILIAVILHIINLTDDNLYKMLHPSQPISFLIFAFSVIWFYTSHFRVFFNDAELKDSELKIGSFINFGNTKEILESSSTKLLNILSSAILLSSYGILYGYTGNNLDLSSGVFILVVIVIDHYLKK